MEPLEVALDKFSLRWYQKEAFDLIDDEVCKRVVLIAPRRCLLGESHIIMADGSWKYLKDIVVGDKILSFSNGIYEEDIVEEVWQTGEKQAFKITNQSYMPLVSSGDHVFACYENQTFKWKPLNKTCMSTRLLQYAHIPQGAVHNPDLAEFIGYMQSDGYVVGYQQPKFTNTNEEILDRVQYLAESLFNIVCIRRPKGNGFDIGMSNGKRGGGCNKNEVKELFRSVGQDIQKSRQRVHPLVFTMDKTSVQRYIAGVISGDGCISILNKSKLEKLENRYYVDISFHCGKSKEYAYDIYWLLRKINIRATPPRLDKKNNWKVTVAKVESVKQLLDIGTIYGKDHLRLKALESVNKYSKTYEITDNSYLSTFHRELHENVAMYDIRTRKNSNFIANGYVVHNSGKDLLGWNLAIRQCLKKTCLVFYVLPTYAQGRKAIFDAITIDGMKFLDFIPSEVIASINQSEMKIRFKNDSILQVIGGDTYDNSLVGTNPYAVILSEYSLMPPDIFSFIRPILAANGGWCLFVACVAPNTLVLTESGLIRIKDVSNSRDRYSDFNKNIYGIGGFHLAEQFYYGGMQETIIITLESGFEIECTPIHPLWNGKEWIKAKNINVGDLIPIQYGQNIWGSGLDVTDFKQKSHEARIFRFDYNNLPIDFYYLLGLIHSDGCYSKDSVTVTNKKDKEIINFLNDNSFKTANDGIHHVLHSRELCEFLEFLEFKHGARNKEFPQKLFNLTQEQMIAFLQGIFDGDGCSASHPAKRGNIKLTSTCLQFIKDLQVILLNFGIVSSLRSEHKSPTKRVKVWSQIYNLEITGHFAHIFYRDIGFRLKRKQANWKYVPASCVIESGNIYPVDVTKLKNYSLPKNIITNPEKITRRKIYELHKNKPHPYLQSLLSEKLFFSKVKKINYNKNEVFDFVIPVSNSFFSNGFLSHNTPRGKNHLWQLYKLAQELPDWRVILQKSSEIHHIPDEVLLSERQQMDEGLYLQEYECSFERGISGSFYGYHLDQLKLKGQICPVPWEPGLLVHTVWDIGVNDATTIIWYQIVSDGISVRIIDSYSNNNLGLDHYAKIIQDKPYRYGKHYAPHDIKVREWGGGAVTRYEKARQLGINFTLVEQVGIIDGIENVWTHFPKLWIDSEKCRSLVNALENYRKEWNDQKQMYENKPVKNWACHFSDAMRYLCLTIHKSKTGMTAEDYERKKAEALYGNGMNLPRFFDNTKNYDGYR